MPLPKRKHSKTRGRKRRTFWKIKSPNFSICPQCKQPKLAHRVCPTCGTYDGLQVVEIKVKKEKKEKPQ
jgi:large subunit ribosomal protein L32